MEALRLQKKFPNTSRDEILELVNKFGSLTTSGKLSKHSALSAIQQSGGSYDTARETLKHVGVDSSGMLEVEDWVELNVKLRTESSTLQHKGTKLTVQGATTSTSHTINQDETREFTRHINSVLEASNNPYLLSKHPIPEETMQLYEDTKDGLVLCALINDSVPDTIDVRVLNFPSQKPLNAFQITENNNLLITSARAIGCSVVNIGSSDISEGREHLVLGLIWQIIRKGLLSGVSLAMHPELYRLCEDGETIEDLLRLTPDQILLRWFNFHLREAGWHRRVNNFSRDVCDGENYTVLLAQIKPDQCTRDPLHTKDLRTRAEQVLNNAEKIGCRKYLTPSSLLSGNPRLNLAFVANLFNTHPSLAPLATPPPLPPVEDFDAEGEREARVFTLWLNSLGVEPAVWNLFDDLKDGLVILQAFDKISPGSVVWRRVSKPSHSKLGALLSPTLVSSNAVDDLPLEEEEDGLEKKPTLSRFKSVENTNYAIDLAKQSGMHIVGMQGADIVDAKRTLVLGLCWQVMRMSIIKTLTSLSHSTKPITDTDLLKWAISTSKSNWSKPPRSFKDPSLSTGLFFLDVLDGIRPGVVDNSLVLRVGESGEWEDKRANAKLAISIARKMNALIFLVPEDIVDVRSRLIMTFVGSLMAIAKQI